MTVRTKVLAAFSAVALTASLAHSSVAFAAAKPSLSLTPVRHGITSGTSPAFHYRVAHLPRKTTTYLEREQGTSRSWVRLTRIRHSSGAYNAPRVTMGRWTYRIAVPGKRSRVVAASSAQRIYSFGNITLRTFCNATDNDGANCGDGTRDIGGRTYRYGMEVDGLDADGGPGAGYENLKTSRASCRSMNLTFGLDDQNSDSNVGFSLIQENANEQDASTGPATIGSTRFYVNSSALSLSVWIDDGGYFVANGTLSCWTASGTY